MENKQETANTTVTKEVQKDLVKIYLSPTLPNDADANLRLGVAQRARIRYNQLNKLSKATHVKYEYGDKVEHETFPAKIRIRGLSTNIKGDVAVLSYYKYATDELGNIKCNVTQIENARGVKVDNLASPIEECVVVETIEFTKPTIYKITELKK